MAETATGEPSDDRDDEDAERARGGPDIGGFIREQRQLAELSLRRLADMAGVSNPYLSQIERGLRKPSADILQQIAKALEVSAETMYVQAGMLDADKANENMSLESEIRKAAELTEEQRKALLGVYRSFVAANAATDSAITPELEGLTKGFSAASRRSNRANPD